MNDDDLEDLYTAEALAKIQTPGGYQHFETDDPITGKSMWLEEPDVPLVLANLILEAHSVARAKARYRVTPWEATLEDLCDDLYVRCSVLEERLKERA